jgi:choline-sulfatase
VYGAAARRWEVAYAGIMARRRLAIVVWTSAMLLAGAASCGRQTAPDRAAVSAPRPSILLVTLDTTRADAVGPDARGVETPAFTALAGRGRRYRQAYAAVPETLPSHSSIMTGLYPAGHGIHENGRYLSKSYPLLAEQLKSAGYRTAAFVSAFVLSRRFGLDRGFDLYDDDLGPGQSERSARETTDRALAYLASRSTGPQLLWVHYFDPHAPYAPAEPFRSRYSKQPYLGEVAAMDAELGRLVAGFDQHAAGPRAIIVVGDHGEGLGDHGEPQHGHLLYQSTMHVPLVVVAPGEAPGVSDTPVSIRRVFHTVLDFAGLGAAHSLRSEEADVVIGEAMKPFLEYGWQPQIMAVSGRQKAIFAGRVEHYDVIADAVEQHDLSRSMDLPRPLRTALDDYPVPSPDAARPPEALSADARQKLASLGYVNAGSAPVIRKDAPRPADMTRLFETLEEASTLFVREEYGKVIPLLERILAKDPNNLDAVLRLATAQSSLGRRAAALAAFKRAASLAPKSVDVRLYLALHYARGPEWEQAVPLLEEVLAGAPERLPALEALAAIRLRQQRPADAIALRQRMYALRPASAAELVQLGQLAMSEQNTPVAIASFESARQQQGAAFTHDLELGVLYLAARRFDDARAALDRVPASHPDYPMALFKRAQVSVLLNEPDTAVRIDLARKHADKTTRDLIAGERLFLQNRSK